MISSRVIAERLGKRHSDVLEALAKILTDGKLCSLIIPSKYKDKKGEMRKEYLLTKDGIKLYLSNCRNITPEQYAKLGIDDLDVVYSYTRFEVSFGSKLKEALQELDIELIEQYNVDGYRVDFYILGENIAIEYDEQQHFTRTNKNKDLERQKYIENKLGCKFVRCDYRDTDIKNVMKVLKQVFKLKGSGENGKRNNKFIGENK